MNKELIYNSGIFADMYEAFLNALRQSNRIVMSGFGWNDVGVSLVLKNWLERNTENRLILLHNTEKRENRLEVEYIQDRWLSKCEPHQFELIPEWFCDTSLDDLMPHIKAS